MVFFLLNTEIKHSKSDNWTISDFSVCRVCVGRHECHLLLADRRGYVGMAKYLKIWFRSDLNG